MCRDMMRTSESGHPVMAEVLLPDLCVMGAGAGGLDAAAGAAAFGVPVVLVEKARMGGGWLNTGSVQSSAFIAAARHARGMTEAEAFGVTAQNTAIDFGKLREHIQSVRDAIAPNATKERFTRLGVRVIDGAARFKD